MVDRLGIGFQKPAASLFRDRVRRPPDRLALLQQNSSTPSTLIQIFTVRAGQHTVSAVFENLLHPRSCFRAMLESGAFDWSEQTQLADRSIFLSPLGP